MNDSIQLLKLSGKLANKLPKLKSNEWDRIFEFLEYYMVVQDETKTPHFINFDWVKIREILMLFDKVE